MLPDKDYLLKLTKMRMPFGKYKGQLLIDLPEEYIIWLAQKGIKKGTFYDILQSVYEIKLNGLEYLLKPLRPKQR